ncbi:unnamed protein product, partial [Larinioides sclopetarius]
KLFLIVFLLYLLFKESILKLLVGTWQGQTLIPLLSTRVLKIPMFPFIFNQMMYKSLCLFPISRVSREPSALFHACSSRVKTHVLVALEMSKIKYYFY